MVNKNIINELKQINMNSVVVNFYLVSNTFLTSRYLEVIPRAQETVIINSKYYTVANVIFNTDNCEFTIHLIEQ